MMNILYEDNHLIAAIKPSGMLSQPDSSGKQDILTFLKAYIKAKYNKPGSVFLGLVHRLDMPVAGLMVFARTSKAASRLSAQIREGKFTKRYMAVVSGRMEEKSGRLLNMLLKNENNYVTEDPSGKESVLLYDELEYDPQTNTSLVDILLVTGRSHQIRVQFALAGHPLKSDMKYNDIDNDKQLLQSKGSGPALFAYRLGFTHPVTGENIDLISFPEDMMISSGFSDFSDIIKDKTQMETK